MGNETFYWDGLTGTRDHIYQIPKGYCISIPPLPLLTRAFEGAMKLSLLLGDKLDLSCESAGKGEGRGYLK